MDFFGYGDSTVHCRIIELQHNRPKWIQLAKYFSWMGNQ
jgi:hypothetical protein